MELEEDRGADGLLLSQRFEGATLDARSAGRNAEASTVASSIAAVITSVRGSSGAMP